MAIDLSKISKEELDQLIKEEALRRRAEMLSESKKKARVAQLAEAKKALEAELKSIDESVDIEEGIMSALGLGGGADAKRKQVVISLLSHPNKGPELLRYADDKQIAQFKQYMPEKAAAIDRFIQGGGRKAIDSKRAESYIAAYAGGAKYVAFDAKAGKYVDTGNVPGNATNAFAEGEAQA